VRACIITTKMTCILLAHLKCTHEHTICDEMKKRADILFSTFFSSTFSLVLYPAYQQRRPPRPVKEIFIVEHEHLPSDTHTHVKSGFLMAVVATRKHKRNGKVMMMDVVFLCSSSCSRSFI